MPVTPRLAAAVPVIAALAVPTAAQAQCDFTLVATFSEFIVHNGALYADLGNSNSATVTITGKTSGPTTGDPQTDASASAAVDLTSLAMTVGGFPGGISDRAYSAGSSMFHTPEHNPTVPPVFRFTKAGDGFHVAPDPEKGSLVFRMTHNYGPNNCPGTMWLGYNFGIPGHAKLTTIQTTIGGETVPDFSGVNGIAAVSVETSATRMPEIDGHGLAYVAFILGTFGLWLHSGPGACPRTVRAES